VNGLFGELQDRLNRGEPGAANVLEWLRERARNINAGVRIDNDRGPAQRLLDALFGGDAGPRSNEERVYSR
jgi:hypothetical protein